MFAHWNVLTPVKNALTPVKHVTGVLFVLCLVVEKKGGELETIAEMVLARHAGSLARRMSGNIVAKIHSEVRREQGFRE